MHNSSSSMASTPADMYCSTNSIGSTTNNNNNNNNNTPATPPVSAPSSRRIACDRCHGLKLRCERGPVIVDGQMTTSLGPCKRCTKARQPCQTRSGPSAKSNNSSNSNNINKSQAHEAATAASVRHHQHQQSSSSQHHHSNQNSIMPDIDSAMSCDGTHTHTPLKDVSSMFGFDNFDALDNMPTPFLCDSSDPFHHLHDGLEVESMQDFFHLSSLEQSHSPITTPASSSRTAATDCSLFSDSEDAHDFIRRTLQLQCMLFDNLRNISALELADAFGRLDVAAAATTGGTMHGHGHGHGHQTHYQSRLMNRVMRASELTASLLKSDYFAANFKTRGNAANGGGSINIPTQQQQQQQQQHQARFSSDGSTCTSTSSSSRRASCQAPNSFPAICSLLTCYVALLCVYRTILFYVRDEVLTQDPAHPSAAVRSRSISSTHSPQEDPYRASRSSTSTSTNSTMSRTLTDQDLLGIRIQVEILSHSLERIEDAWATALDGKMSTSSPYESPDSLGHGYAKGRGYTENLLLCMLQHEGIGTAGGSDWLGIGGLVAVVNSIKFSIRLMRG